MKREVWPEEYVSPSTHHGCRPMLPRNEALRRAAAERKRRSTSDEPVGDNGYTQEEHLTNVRLAGARR